MKRLQITAAMTALGLALLAGCGDSSPGAGSADGLKGETIAVAFDVDGRPFAYVENGSTPAGFDVDVMQEIAKRSGFKLKMTALPFDGILPALQAGQVQIAAAAISITEERQQVVRFSTPYYQTGITLATRPSNTEIQTIEDLKGRSVAVRTGSSNSLYVEGLPFADEIEIHRYNSTNDQLQAVLSGVDDAAVNDGSILDYYIAQKGEGKLEVRGPLLTTDNYGYAVPRDREDLQKAINSSLTEMATDGTYADIYKKYFGKEPSALPGDIG